jgi:glutamyl-tRNA synthetase
MRSNGHPLYMLAATVDDVLMGMTHILRGEDLVSATPRQLAMYAALGVPRERFPAFGHLPLIVGDDGKPLSKRNGEVSIRWYRDNGFLPSAMLNYLALLGWSLDGEHELFSLAELVEVFSIERVGRNPARFDLKKLEAINGDKIRALPEATLADLAMQQLTAAGVTADADVVARAVPLVQTRLARLTEIPGLLGFLFADPFAVEEAAAEKVLTADAAPVLAAAVAALSGLTEWTTVAIEESLRTALIEGLGLKPKHAFTPVRVAVTGRTVSPPLFESLELLGRDRTLSRLSAAAR